MPTEATCGVPCCGGSACTVTVDNSGHGGCATDAGSCNACQSGLACLEGTCNALLAPAEVWNLRASYIGGGGVPDMCASSRRDAWACVRRAALDAAPSENWTCLPMSEPCASTNAHGTTAVAVTTHDITVGGLDIEIRDQRPDGPVLAERRGARYTTGILRQGLCSGLKFDKLRDTAGSGISVFAYFLDSP